MVLTSFFPHLKKIKEDITSPGIALHGPPKPETKTSDSSVVMAVLLLQFAN
jgi:hypothetical protein